MTSIDDLFKRPNIPSKRKFEPIQDPTQTYKSAKLTLSDDAKSTSHASVEDEIDEEEAGPQLPPDGEDDYGPDEDEEGRFFGGGVDEGTKEALDYIDEQDKEPYVSETIDISWLRKTAVNFEKRVSKNAELRARYEDDPQKFMGSEADLDADIKTLSILSEHPELYTEFSESGLAGQLVSLLAHENTDIAIDAIEIISELTDEDIQTEQEQWDSLVNALLESDLLSLLIQNFERFDESNEVDRSGVYNALNILENLASQPTICDKIGADFSIFTWLVSRIQKKESPVTQNKQYATEVLAILLQSSNPNRKILNNLNGVDMILQLLSAYRKRDPPKDSEEEEYAENLFDCLTCLVEEKAGKAKFVDAEGVELCLIMLREGKMSKPRALRVLDHAMASSTPTMSTESDNAEELASAATGVCERLVEAAGLKTIFGMFMKKQDNAITEHLLGIFAALLRSLPGDSAPRIRTLAKFVEKDYEKIIKIIKLRRDYASRISIVDQQIQRERAGLDEAERDEFAGEWLSRRLGAGLFSLQTIDVVLTWLLAEDDGARKRITELLAERDESLTDLRDTLKEQLEGVGDDGDQTLKDMLETLISFLE